MTIDLTDIIVSVIALLTALVTTFLVPWLKTKLDANKWAKLVDIAGIAVNAAEQLFKGSGRGDEKLTYVLNYLNSQGYDVNDETIRNVIEDAVFKIGEAATNGNL